MAFPVIVTLAHLNVTVTFNRDPRNVASQRQLDITDNFMNGTMR
ncbi:hypothetical protein [Atlantibacter hermannii]|nr:hypothetical protein [Atlantibacter hermannii]